MLCTEPFEGTATKIARVLCLADYPFRLVDRPIGNCTLLQLTERAEMAYAQALPLRLAG